MKPGVGSEACQTRWCSEPWASKRLGKSKRVGVGSLPVTKLSKLGTPGHDDFGTRRMDGKELAGGAGWILMGAGVATPDMIAGVVSMERSVVRRGLMQIRKPNGHL